MKTIRKLFSASVVLAGCVNGFSIATAGQSTELNFPTAVTTNEISGIIKVRDVGDARLTSYFYYFDGGQGDLFTNVVTKNFSGDIDVFAAEGLRPLTKMVIYADSGERETGRLIYLRKPERLILRVEGRSPNDDPATFRIKFAGSFIALSEKKQQETPTVARRDADAESGVRVNSVGTIVAIIPKPQPTAKATPEAMETVAFVPKPKKSRPAKTVIGSPPAATTNPAKPPIAIPSKKPSPSAKLKENKPAKPSDEIAASTPVTTTKPPNSEASEVRTVFKKVSKPKTGKAPNPPVGSKPDPMAGFRLVVQFKDGNVTERPMNEVTRFSVDKGMLTVTAKDGKIVRYSMLDVAKVTIE